MGRFGLIPGSVGRPLALERGPEGARLPGLDPPTARNDWWVVQDLNL